MIERPDLEAALDVLNDFVQQIDGLNTHEAVGYRDLVGDIAAQAGVARSLLDQQIMRQLEQPRVIGNRRYRRKPKGVNRWDHTAVQRRVIEFLRIDRVTGEVRDVGLAIEALRMFATLYLSGSSQAKKSGARTVLGIADPVDEGLVEWVRTGSELEVTELKEES